MEEYTNTSKEIAMKLIEYLLDLDYMDNEDTIKDDLNNLEHEIESIRETHNTLSHALDMFASTLESECPLINQLLANE